METQTHQTVPAHRTAYAHRALLQNLYREKIDLSNIPNDLKQTIMDQSAARLGHYEPAKYITRSETKCSILGPKQMLLMKKKRLETVFNEGFFSDPKELYRPIGQVIIDTKDLLYQSLQLEINPRDAKELAQIEAIQQNEQKLQMKMKFHKVPKRHDHGFNQIKEKLAQSKARLGCVKFGAPFGELISSDKREKIYDSLTPVVQETKEIKWGSPLKIDEEKRLHFASTYNRYMQTQKQNTKILQGKYDAKLQKRAPSASQNLKGYETAKPVVVAKPHEIQTKPTSFTTKQMEEVLEINRKHNTSETTNKFFDTRDHFYERRTRMNFNLAEDLDRLDQMRRKKFEQKVKYFNITDKGTETIHIMREKANRETKLKVKQIIDSHPWYNELVNKVVVLNGAKREVTSHEAIILQHVRKLVEDEIRFTKQVFYNLIKLLPTRDFLKDEIQRIVRFIKQHEIISERDYIEVVELAGHTF